jgi:2-iminobutanoate/2-iminopropanoate deaminase
MPAGDLGKHIIGRFLGQRQPGSKHMKPACLIGLIGTGIQSSLTVAADLAEMLRQGHEGSGFPDRSIAPGHGCGGSNMKRSFTFTPADGVPPGVGPFSHATQWGDLLFVTGQMPTDPATGAIVAGDVLAQAEQVRRNLEAVLAQFSLTLDDALMVRVYLTSFDDYGAFNAAYTGWFKGPLPSRTCVGVTGLAVGAVVEIDLIAGIPAGAK